MTNAKLARARARYLAGKDVARHVVVETARAHNAETVLDLWGGGASARAFAEALPDAYVTSAERDRDMWPALRLDAQRYGYAYHFGDVTQVEGDFDVIWLDACGQASKALRDLVHFARSRLRDGGLLFVTVMPARETEPLFSTADRLLMVPLWLEQVTGLFVRLLLPYERGHGQSMWLIGLSKRWGSRDRSWFNASPGSAGDWLTDESLLDLVRGELADCGFFAHPGFLEPDVANDAEDMLTMARVAA